MTMREKDTAAADMDTAATTIAADIAETDKVRRKFFGAIKEKACG